MPIHGEPNPTDPTQYWDEQLQAYRNQDIGPQEPRRPSQATIDGIVDRLNGAISRNIRPDLLFAEFTHDDVQILTALAYWSSADFDAFVTRIRTLGTQAGWTERQLTEIPFRSFKRDAERLQDEVSRVRRALERNARATRQWPARPSRREREELSGAMTPDQMIETESPYLIAVGYLLKHRRERLWFDDFSNQIYTDWSGTDDVAVYEALPLTDALILNIRTWLITKRPEELARLTTQTTTDAIVNVAQRDHRHQVRDWLTSLQWDGQARLVYLMPKGFATADNPYTQRISANWLVSMVARVMRPGCQVDTMPVFYGAQGDAKTKALRIIGGKWYDDVVEKSENKDFMMKLRDAWLIEIAEMHSIASSRSDHAHVKAMLTRLHDRFRPPYGRSMETFLRQCVFAGTTNVDDWHVDPTGGRRFWPVKCLGRLDLAWIEENRDQLFAEALAAYRQNHQWWVMSETVEQLHAEALEEQRAVHPFENIITQWVERLNGTLYDGGSGIVASLPSLNGESNEERWGNVLTTERVAMQFLGLTLDQMSRHVIVISTSLQRLGWVKSQRQFGGGQRLRLWVRRDQRPVADLFGGEEPC